MTFNFLLLTQVYIRVDHLQVCHTRSTLRRTNTPPLLFTYARILPSGAPEKNPKLSRRGDRTSVKEERNDCAMSQTVSSCIIALSSFSVILNHWHFISMIYISKCIHSLWLDVVVSFTLYIMFIFFFFSFLFSLNKYSRLSFHLCYVLSKALTWKCIYSMLENWYIVINNKRVVCFHKLRSHTKVYCCLIPYVTRARGYKTTEVYYMIKLVM